ncbi:MAG: hypothetical protein HY810_04190 [Candidatus Omnitrophica bacterium]|nr:hypothetical protein [Candidatus Omnitrophota bacterium]
MMTNLKSLRWIGSIFISLSICQLTLALTVTAEDNNLIDKNSPFGIHPAVPYDEAQNMGVKWTRGGAGAYFFWSLVDPDMAGDPAQFKWQGVAFRQQGKGVKFNYDELYNTQEAGFQILYNIDIQPKLARGYRKNDSWLPVDEDAYKNFVKAVVRRYAFVRYWQIGNEPTADKMQDYGRFISITYNAIKEADPGAKVLIGGVSGMKMPHTISEYRLNFNKFYLPLLEDIANQNKRCFDIFDFHLYGDVSGDYLLSRDIYNYISRMINKLGIPEPEEYWITEMGTYSGDPVQVIRGRNNTKDWPYQSEKQQAIDIVKRYVYPLSSGIKKIFLAWGLKEGFKNDQGYFDFTGLIYDGRFEHDQGSGVRKLSYYTYKKMAEVLEGSDWSNIEIVQESEGLYIYKFIKQEKPIWVAWNDSENEKQIVIFDIAAKQTKITEAVPKYELGKKITDYNTAFNTRIMPANDSKISLILKDIPVFIELQ